MILPIIINTQDIVDQFTSLKPKDIEEMLDNVAKGLALQYANKVEQEAQRVLHQTRKRYLKNLKVVDSGKLSGTVMLDYSKDKLVQMLEEGASPFDMKQYFLASPKAKIGKNGGKFLTIPFRWATPGAVGESDVFAFKLPESIYNIVKAKPAEYPTSGGGLRSAGIALSEIPEAMRVKKIRPAITDIKGKELFQAYQHKSNIYEGIVKQQDSVTKQNTYRSFRRVSENSDPDAFVHPGLQKYQIMQKAMEQFDIPSQLSNLLDQEFSKKGLI